MESTRLTGQGIRDLNDRGPKKKPAAAEVPAPDAGEQPVGAAEAEAGTEAIDAQGVPTRVTVVASVSRTPDADPFSDSKFVEY